jgi:SPP1 gp7 family putative phage head morphogenesis protein
MPDVVNIRAIALEADNILKGMENGALSVLEKGIRKGLADLESELEKLYNPALQESAGRDIVFAQLRGQALLKNLTAQLEAFQALGDPASGGVQAVTAMLEKVHKQGLIDAYKAIKPYQQAQIPFQGKPDMKAVAHVANRSAENLHKHSAEFVSAAQVHIISGLLRGKGLIDVANNLRKETGSLMAGAARVVRTESIGAHDASRRAGYKANGIQYVQRSAAHDARVCEYCATRHGRIYPIDEAPALLHPHDRCANLPFRPEWIDDGLVDLEEFEKERRVMLDGLRRPANHGPAPFEKLGGKKPPKDISRDLLRGHSRLLQGEDVDDPVVEMRIVDAMVAQEDFSGAEQLIERLYRTTLCPLPPRRS